MNYTFASVLITADNQAAVQELVGDGYFTAGYSADGSVPATHYLSTGAFDNIILKHITTSKLFEQISFGQETETFGLMAAQEDISELSNLENI